MFRNLICYLKTAFENLNFDCQKQKLGKRKKKEKIFPEEEMCIYGQSFPRFKRMLLPRRNV